MGFIPGRTAVACGVLLACGGAMAGMGGMGGMANAVSLAHAGGMAATGGAPLAGPTGYVEAWQPPFAAPSLDGAGNVSVPDGGETSCAGTSYCAMVGVFATGRTNSNITAYVWEKMNGSWDAPRQVPGLAALNLGGKAVARGVACAAPGNCAAGGSYSPGYGGPARPWVISEVNGAWQPAQAVAGLAALAGADGEIDRVSCAAPGFCTATGEYHSQDQDVMFAVAETDGRWGNAQELPGIGAVGGTSIESLTCPSRGNCTAVGSDLYGESGNAFVIDEVNGSWQHALRVEGMPAGEAGLVSVSCASAGNCMAVGSSTAVNAFGTAMEVTETNGRWGSAHALAGGSASSVSCPADGDCTVVTAGDDTGSSAGYVPATGDIVEEVNGAWRKPLATPGYVPDTVSCTGPGYCSATAYWELGDVSTPAESAIAVIDETAGSWGSWNLLQDTITWPSEPEAVIGPLSCGAPGNCALHGYYDWQYGPRGEWAAAKSLVPVTATTLAPPNTAVVFGHHQAGRFGVNVLASSGTPAGQVDITAGQTTLCSVRLAAGRGGCELPPTLLHPGAYLVAAHYEISAGFAPSYSGGATLVITKAATVTRLALSRTTVRFGGEGSVRLSVSVTPSYAGVPGGSVTVMTGKTSLCTIRLSARKGTCTLAAQTLRPGRYRLTARYQGNADYSPSRSAAVKLAVLPS